MKKCYFKYSILFIVLMLVGVLYSFFSRTLFPQNKSTNDKFVNTYTNKNTLDEFSGENKRYSISVELGQSEVVLFLENKDNSWQGHLEYTQKDNDNEEVIPIWIENNDLVISASIEKRVSMDKILLFKNFDVGKFIIQESFRDEFDMPTEEVVGKYPVEDIKEYATQFYEEIISCLSNFRYQDEYFEAVSSLDSVEYRKVGYTLTRSNNRIYFAFNGGKNKKWKPEVISAEKVSLIIIEDSYGS